MTATRHALRRTTIVLRKNPAVTLETRLNAHLGSRMRLCDGREIGAAIERE